jgi:malate dehydrogenase
MAAPASSASRGVLRASLVLSHVAGSASPAPAADLGAAAWPVLKAACGPDGKPLRVCVSGAAGAIAYSLVFMIANGDMFGRGVPLDLVLFDIPPMATALQGVAMELADGVYNDVKNVQCSVDAQEAFKGCDVVILVGAFPRKKGMERKDLLEKNAAIFRDQGKALDARAARHCKVLVVGNPANTNAVTCSHFAPSLDPRNFSALTRLDQHRAKYQLASKTQTDIGDIRNVAIWGNHSSTQVPDVRFATATTSLGATPASTLVNDKAYLEGDFVKTVQVRGAEIIKTRGGSSAASAARAIVMHMKDWVHGTAEGEFASMAVSSNRNSYGIPDGLMFSFPVTCSGGDWTVVPNLPWDDFTKAKITTTTEELLNERRDVFALLGE